MLSRVEPVVAIGVVVALLNCQTPQVMITSASQTMVVEWDINALKQNIVHLDSV